MDNSSLYSILTRFGDYYQLKLNNGNVIKELETNFEWVKYNPRKNIRRDGLSITSLDGGLSGRPDLDSLYEHYKDTGEEYTESDFRTKTPVYDYFKECLDPIEKHLGRTHILRLRSGGFFPPHRDNMHINIDTFRLFLPFNYDSNKFFMMEDKRMEFVNRKMYFINTAKTHTLFNTDLRPFYFLVANVILTEESVQDTLKFLQG